MRRTMEVVENRVQCSITETHTGKADVSVLKILHLELPTEITH